MCEPFRRILAGTLPLYIIINCPTKKERRELDGLMDELYYDEE